ncbi:RPE1 [Symbiodinium sp. KB8]|nr:RPE1 [Symbiodinium sp. KB8]
MVTDPGKWVEDFGKAGEKYLELLVATEDPGALIERIKSAGMKPAIAVKPKTDVDEVMKYADQLHMVLIMTVEPGFGGQKFMEDMMPKVDGGLDEATVKAAAAAGANVIVAGTSIFKSADPKATIANMRSAIDGSSE